MQFAAEVSSSSLRLLLEGPKQLWATSSVVATGGSPGGHPGLLWSLPELSWGKSPGVVMAGARLPEAEILV